MGCCCSTGRYKDKYKTDVPTNEDIYHVLELFLPVQAIVDIILYEYQYCLIYSFETAIQHGKHILLGTILKREKVQNNLFVLLHTLQKQDWLRFCLRNKMYATLDVLCHYFNLYFNGDERLRIFETCFTNENLTAFGRLYPHMYECITPMPGHINWNKQLLKHTIGMLSSSNDEKNEYKIHHVFFPVEVDFDLLGIGRDDLLSFLFECVYKNQLNVLNFFMSN